MGKQMISVTLPSGAVATFKGLGIFAWLALGKEMQACNGDVAAIYKTLVRATLLGVKPAHGPERIPTGQQGEFEGALLDKWFDTPSDAQVYFEVVQNYHSPEEGALGKALATVSVTTA